MGESKTVENITNHHDRQHQSIGPNKLSRGGNAHNEHSPHKTEKHEHHGEKGAKQRGTNPSQKERQKVMKRGSGSVLFAMTLATVIIVTCAGNTSATGNGLGNCGTGCTVGSIGIGGIGPTGGDDDGSKRPDGNCLTYGGAGGSSVTGGEGLTGVDNAGVEGTSGGQVTT